MGKKTDTNNSLALVLRGPKTHPPNSPPGVKAITFRVSLVDRLNLNLSDHANTIFIFN